MGARFGELKFGTFKFGPSVLDSPKFALEVDWDANDLFSGARERDMESFSVTRGRQYTVSPNGERFEEEETGKFTAKFYDQNGRYDFYNENSPLYGMLSGGKRFRMKVRTPEDAIHYVMSGVLDEPAAYTERGLNMATLTGVDGWGFLREQAESVTIPLQESIYAHEAMALILEKASWPPVWPVVLDDGSDLRNYYWVDQKSAARAIHELAGSELGTVCVQANGAMRFRARASSESDVIAITHDDCLKVSRATPKDVIRNLIRVRTRPLSVQSQQVVWSLPGELEINPGGTVEVWAEYEYNGQSAPVKNPVDPLVAGTDYEGWTGSGKTGSNVTSDISVSLYSFSTRAKLEVTNNGAVLAYVSLKVRGEPIAAQNSATFENDIAESIRQFGARPFTLEIDQNLNKARQYASLLAGYLAGAKNFLIVDLMPNHRMQFGVDLGQVIRGNFPAYHIDKSYRVIRIEHRNRGNLTQTRWWLEPYVRLFTGVQLPVQIPFQFGGITV
jgi:hypothetical protein